MTTSYVPDRGHLVWLSFSQQRGREQAGRRPALVLSPRNYNQRAGLAIACPITSRVKGYPFEVEVAGVASISGAILVDHLRSLGWRSRKAERIGDVPPVLEQVMAKLRPLLGMG